MNNSDQILLHLSLIEGIGAGAIEKIIAAMSTDRLAALYSFTQKDIMHRCGVSYEVAAKIVQGLRNCKIIDDECALLEKNNITLISITSPIYPTLLKEIHLPPPILYVRGVNLSALNNLSLAIVGARIADAYGRQVINFLMPDLITSGLVIVSGGAKGADSFAHEAALAVGGTTIAVLGSGLLKPYPSSNHRLFQQIVERNGLLISSFPLNTAPLPGNFPARNRIIAGLSQACLVVQADIKSGARITAQFALEQGRDVFAIPGLITSALSSGCHELIKQGAGIVTCAADILQQLKGVNFCIQNTQPATQSITFATQQHERIYELCAQAACSLDMIVEQTNFPLPIIQNILFDLHIENLIRQDLSGKWCL